MTPNNSSNSCREKPNLSTGHITLHVCNTPPNPPDINSVDVFACISGPVTYKKISVISHCSTLVMFRKIIPTTTLQSFHYTLLVAVVSAPITVNIEHSEVTQQKIDCWFANDVCYVRSKD